MYHKDVVLAHVRVHVAESWSGVGESYPKKKEDERSNRFPLIKNKIKDILKNIEQLR